MRIVYFGIYDPEFSRNRIYMRALREAGHTVDECRDTLAGPIKYVRLAWKLLRKWGTYDLLVVGYPGHVVVPIARLFATALVVADLLGSLADAGAQSHGASILTRIRLSVVDWLAIKSADCILVESEAQKKYLASRYGSAAKYSVVYTGTDETTFAPRPQVVEAEKFVVLFRGRLTPESGIMHILGAAESLRAEGDIVFRIVGYGPLLERVRDRIKQTGLTNVELIPNRLTFEEMRAHMLDANVSLGQFEDNPRLQRTIPHKLFESISMGIPYVTARVPAAEELLKDNESALMVPLTNPSAIAAAIRTLKNDRLLGAKLSGAARRIFEEKTSAPTLAHKIVGLGSRLTSRTIPIAVELMALALIAGAFLALRAPGIDLPFHQDEAKIAIIADEQIVGSLAAHPPLTEILWRWSGQVLDAMDLRLVPLLFSTLSAILLYVVVRRRAGAYAAYLSLILYVVCAYSVLASLMLDIDGAVLPMLFLAVVVTYDRAHEALSARRRLAWGVLCAAFLVIGLLVKLSFVLVVGALALDIAWSLRRRLRTVSIRLGLLILLVGSALAAAVIFIADWLSASVDFAATMDHALSYFRFQDRGYFQTTIQGAKALMYLSPLLLAPLIFIRQDDARKTSIFLWYLLVGSVFYFILFDFSTGALDKYLMFSIVPLAAIGGVVCASIFERARKQGLLIGAGIGAVVSLGLFALNFLPHYVVPQYPKDAWLAAIAAMNWNILFPFTGGSGPLGFYLSLLFIIATFTVTAIIALGGRLYERFRVVALASVIVVSIMYNGVMAQELLLGKINGSAPDVLRSALAYMSSRTEGGVITHADAGNYELRLLGAYSGRFYAVPGYEASHKELFAEHTGRYFVVDMPPLNRHMFYSRFFSTCKEEFVATSGRVQSHVYYCPNSDPYSID